MSIVMSVSSEAKVGDRRSRTHRDEGAGVGPYWEPLGLVAATKEEPLR
jgi:hypothetical protein